MNNDDDVVLMTIFIDRFILFFLFSVYIEIEIEVISLYIYTVFDIHFLLKLITFYYFFLIEN